MFCFDLFNEMFAKICSKYDYIFFKSFEFCYNDKSIFNLKNPKKLQTIYSVITNKHFTDYLKLFKTDFKK